MIASLLPPASPSKKFLSPNGEKAAAANAALGAKGVFGWLTLLRLRFTKDLTVEALPASDIPGFSSF